MVENPLAVEPITSFYIHRLDDLLLARQQIDNPDFKIQYWEGVPIYRTDDVPGLRWGIDFSIVSSLIQLRRMGMGEAAKTMIEIKGVRHG